MIKLSFAAAVATSSGLHIFHTDDQEAAVLTTCVSVCLFCSTPALTSVSSQGGIAAGVPGSGANERGEQDSGPTCDA